MPYIKPHERVLLSVHNDDNQQDDAKTPGQLNFQITELIKLYFKQHRDYQGINDILGALEGAKLEFYRRIAAPYEYSKIIENGDVYD